MKKSNSFDRWNAVYPSTWSFQVFNKYNDELNNMMWANKGTSATIYQYLKEKGANWNDKASTFLKFDVPHGEEVFPDLKDWSKSFNEFQNWVNLNSLMTLVSNLETYMAASASLALQSDPGVLFSSPKSIDGVLLLKNGVTQSCFNDNIIESITKGGWEARTNAFRRTFGIAPSCLEKNISDLDKIRNLRNKIGHAFGRDINKARNHELKSTLMIEKLKDDKLKKIQRIIWSTAKSIDCYLLENHIGEFQAVAFYHRMYNSLRKDIHPSQRAVKLKKELGSWGNTIGKGYCKELVNYYEQL